MVIKTKNIVLGDYFRFTLITNKLIRLEYSESGKFEDSPTQIVLNRDFGEVDYELIKKEDHLEIITDYFHLYYKYGPFSSSNLYIDVKYNFSNYHNRWHYGSVPETLKGTTRTLDFVDGAIELEEGIISKNGFALLDDSNSFLLDEKGDPVPRKFKEIDLYFFAYGRNYLEALKDYFRLTGSIPLLPRYALGNWWSRYWKYTEKEYLDLMHRFKDEGIPLSVSVIDMDWHLTNIPERFGSGWTGYTWNKELFPDPKRFLSKLHELGLHVTLNVHPADGIRAFEEQYPIVAEKLGLNQELEEPAKFNIADPDFRKVYFEDVHHPLEEKGVDFWWIDWQQGTESGQEGLDPLWLLNHYHYLDVQRKNKNDIILSRYAGPGSHRYPVGFSGDTIISWESLDFQPYFTATASNIGYTWWSHDIGGHMLGCRDDELALRWVQFGVFSPINRLHSSSSAFTGKEPWRYNDIVYPSMKRFLRLRHALIPYLYTINVLSHEEGLPLIQPMYYHHAMEEEAYQVPNQYYFGTEMVVAPITKKSDSVLKAGETIVWLPKGYWYDFFTGKRYKGGTKLKVFREITEMPVLVKQGGIIPLDENVMETKGEALPETIHWRIFPGKSNSFTLTEDHGNKRALTTLTLNWDEKTVKLEVSGETSILPKGRKHFISIFAVDGIETVEMLQHHPHITHLEYDEKNNILQFQLTEWHESIEITLKNLAEIKEQDIHEELFRRLDIAEIPYKLKDQLWNEFKSTIDNLQFLSKLNNIENRKLADSIFELLYIKNS